MPPSAPRPVPARQAEVGDDGADPSRPALVAATSMTLALLKSRWTTPASWAAASAAAICSTSGRASSGGSRPRFESRSASVSPGEELHRQERARRRSWWKTSKMRQTLGCVTLRARWISRRKRSIARWSLATSGRIVFRATPLAQDLVLGLVDLAHAAAGDEADDAEAPARTSPSASPGARHICLPEPDGLDGIVGGSVIGRGSGLLLSLEVDLRGDLRDAIGEDDDEIVAPRARERPAHGLGLVLRLLDRRPGTCRGESGLRAGGRRLRRASGRAGPRRRAGSRGRSAARLPS